jgi:HSP20 family protein
MTIFDDLMRLTRQLHLAEADRLQPIKWRPATDVYCTQEGWLVKMELAGVHDSDIELYLDGRILIVSGMRYDRPLMEGCKLHALEIAYSPFERSIEFPVDLDQAQIMTEYQDGMLWVRILTKGDKQ